MKIEKSKTEIIKEESRGLRGSILQELVSGESGVSADTATLLKFHGIYQYDDRDLRRTLLREGKAKDHRFVVRTKTPGGALSAEQWLILDEAADRYGNSTLRLTSRQDVQLHGVGKPDLKSLVQLLNTRLISTFGACGDGVRNVVACPVSAVAKGSDLDAPSWAARISQALTFSSTAYLEIWLDRDQSDPQLEEPLFGPAYLPRKFKIAMASEHDNCADVYTNDVGIVPVIQKRRLAGFDILAGGGLGSSHGNKDSYPRLAEPLCRVNPEQLIPTLRALVAAYRDLGDRSDRKHARLKYVIEEQGIEQFRSRVEKLLGRALAAPGAVSLSPRVSHLGWQPQRQEGLNCLGLFIESGRIHDQGAAQLKSGLRAAVTQFRPRIALTPDENIVLLDIPDRSCADLENLLNAFRIPLSETISPLRQNTIACPALPTCGLALTEAERLLPRLMSDLEALGCGSESVSIRISGCPNSCSRAPVAEIGVVGRSGNGYHLYLGGSPRGDRLARLFRENVPAEHLPVLIARLIGGWRGARAPGESFGDWWCRVGAAESTLLKSSPADPVGFTGPVRP
ncbi:MAG: NADPH-dependent assimilatory sulfite reductase hemoprotein subunit [Acidobacteriota bacterium]